MIFIPMAISGIAAAVTWRFIYFYAPPGNPQIYLLNAIWTGVTGQDPIPWLTIDAARVNSFLLMFIVIWLQVGFAMVLLSAAIKGVPEETIEAARLDGASERKTFFLVIVPQIRGTVLAVFVTVTIFVMKSFDIIYAMTGGQYNTSVLVVEFYLQLFSFQNPGKAAGRDRPDDRRDPADRVPSPQLQVAGGTPMTFIPTPIVDEDAGKREIVDLQAKSKKRNADGTEKRKPHVLITIIMAIIALAWLFPLLGLLITSFRSKADVDATGWWTVFLNPFGQDWTSMRSLRRGRRWMRERRSGTRSPSRSPRRSSP